MQCHVIILLLIIDTTGTTYTFYEIEKGKGTIKEKTKTEKTNRKRKRRKNERKLQQKKQYVVAPPRRRGGQHLKKNELEKKNKITKTPLNRVRQRTEEKITKGKYQVQTKAQSTLQAAAVCGTSSIARFSLLSRLVPCYPDSRLRPAFVNYAQPLGVTQYETCRAGSSSNHATRLLQYGLPGINQKRKRKKENENHGESAQERKKQKKKEKTREDHVRTRCTSWWHQSQMSGDMSRKAKYALSRVYGRVFHTKTQQCGVTVKACQGNSCCLSRDENAVT